MPSILQVMRQMKTAVGQRTALYGLVTGPFTLASHLRGTEIFMDLVDQPEYAQALLAYTAQAVNAVVAMYIEAGMDVIAVVDPVISQISPRHFKRFMHEPFHQVFDFIRAAGRLFGVFCLRRRHQEYRGHVPDRARLHRRR